MPPPKRTHPTHEKLPPHPPPGRHTVQSSLATLRNWREGSAATAISATRREPSSICGESSAFTASGKRPPCAGSC